MAAQTPILPRAGNLRIEELPNHCQQIIKRQQEAAAQAHRHRLLRRGHSSLQPVRRVAAIMHGVTLAPLPEGLRGCAITISQDPGGLGERLDRRPNPGRRRRLPVKLNQDQTKPS